MAARARPTSVMYDIEHPHRRAPGEIAGQVKHHVVLHLQKAVKAAVAPVLARNVGQEG
jgi:hypothetical protein